VRLRPPRLLTWLPSLCVGLAACSGCTAPPVQPDLDADHAAAKVPALVAEADRGPYANYAALVRALDDDDPAARFAAARALQQLTGESLGYRFFDDRLARQDAVARWQAWVIQRQSGTPRTSATPSSPRTATTSAPEPTP
jgi:hypothetical protein